MAMDSIQNPCPQYTGSCRRASGAEHSSVQHTALKGKVSDDLRKLLPTFMGRRGWALGQIQDV